MSLVGPRPERPYFVDQLTAEVPFYAVRHCVKPGLTGWAQVRYQYGASVDDAVQKLQYDLYYVKNHTLFLDSLILCETVRVVLTGQGRIERIDPERCSSGRTAKAVRSRWRAIDASRWHRILAWRGSVSRSALHRNLPR